MLFLKILGGLVALGAGLYFGLAGSYRPDPEELDQALMGAGVSRRAKRHFTPLGWLRKNQERSSKIRFRTRGSSSRRFQLISPEKPGEKKGS